MTDSRNVNIPRILIVLLNKLLRKPKGQPRNTCNIVHNTQNEDKQKVYICLTTNYVEIFDKCLLQFPDFGKNMAYHRLAYMSNTTSVTSRTATFRVTPFHSCV